jgi:Nuclease-related domain
MNRETGGKVDRDAGPEAPATGSAAPAERHDQATAGQPQHGAAGSPEQAQAVRDEPGAADRAQRPANRDQRPAGPDQTPAGPDQTPAGPDQTPAGPDQTPAGPDQTPAGPAQTPAGPEPSPGNHDQAPAGPEPSPGNHDQAEREQARRSLIPAFRPNDLPFQGLAADPRLPIWITRALIAIAIGATVLIWQSWRLGLTAAAVVVIADIIYRSRTTSVIPAAVRATSAQRRSRRRLALLRSAGYVALHGRAIPGSDQVIDHLVIGPAGVFALDSERWDRRLPVRTATGGRLYHGPFSQDERLDHAQWEATQAGPLVSAALGTGITVRPAMAIYGPTIPWTVASLRGVDVFAGRRLRRYFRRQSRERRAVRLDAGQIGLIHAAAARALPPAQ